MTTAVSELAFRTDPDELEREIAGLGVCHEPILDPLFSESDQRRLEKIYPGIAKGQPATVRILRGLVRRYPHSPTLKNHLMVALNGAGRRRECDAMGRRIMKEHPDYLFGLTNEANKCLLNGKADRVPELLGSTLSLAAFRPEVKEFHPSEIRGYYTTVASFHLAKGAIPVAEAIHRALVKIVGAHDSALDVLENEIMLARLSALSERLEDDKKRSIIVQCEEEQSGACDSEPPVLEHQELSCLYREALDLEPNVIASLLALPRASLVADLEKVLQDAVTRGAMFRDKESSWSSAETCFPIHALSLLGELDATEAMPTVLDFIAAGPGTVEYWFGDYFGELAVPPLVRVVGDQLDGTIPWMLRSGLPGSCRAYLADVAAASALQDPARRAEVLHWFEQVLGFLLDSPPSDQILDTDLVTALIWSLADLAAEELLPLVRRSYERGYVMIQMVGSLEEVTSSLKGEPKKRGGTLPLNQRYRKINSIWQQAAREREEDLLTGPRSSPISVGRNDPCPCGSGKKFKRCCLDS